MKQVVQNYRNGDLWLEDVPRPACRAGGVLVRNEYSVVSTGTERMKVEQARMSLLEKAKARPDQVKKVLQNVSQMGVRGTIDKVQERLDALTPLGYSCVGIVEEVGAGIDHIKVGDRVVCAGEGIACHAEFVFAPRNLCALVPEAVDPREAAFATIGAIAMNGVRQAEIGLGDVVVVIGLGLVGLLGVQILKAAGARVIGIDIDNDKLELARLCGAEAALHRKDPALEDVIRELTAGHGADAVYVAASAKSSDPLDLAGEVIRDRGRVCIVGMVPVHADWRTYYGKELSVVLSRSYGPGRYDRNYEDKGIDYPIGYVPWTERRNLEEFVRLVGEGLVTPTKFGATEYAFSEAPDAYAELHEDPGKHAGGILFRYPQAPSAARRIALEVAQTPRPANSDAVRIGLIGAGNFATGTLIPAMKKSPGCEIAAVCSAGGLSAKGAAARHGAGYASSDYDAVLADERIDSVVIATRHNTHAAFTIKALDQGKHVFVEKPLALSFDELEQVARAARSSSAILMPGFNRRFSPLAESARDHFSAEGGALSVTCRINSGRIEAESWYQDTDEGGWRIVSEGCHWIDLVSFLVRSAPTQVSAHMISGAVPGGQNDSCMLNIAFANGAIANLAYLSNGDAHFEKERIEVFGQEKVAVIENWHKASLYENGKRSTVRPKGSGKGHAAEMAAFVAACRTGSPSPISLDSAIATSATALLAVESMLDGGTVRTLQSLP